MPGGAWDLCAQFAGRSSRRRSTHCALLRGIRCFASLEWRVATSPQASVTNVDPISVLRQMRCALRARRRCVVRDNAGAGRGSGGGRRPQRSQPWGAVPWGPSRCGPPTVRYPYPHHIMVAGCAGCHRPAAATAPRAPDVPAPRRRRRPAPTPAACGRGPAPGDCRRPRAPAPSGRSRGSPPAPPRPGR